MKEISKKPFSVGLYIEGLRQLRILGILSTIFLFGASLIRVIGEVIFVKDQTELFPDEVFVLSANDGLEAMPFLLFTFCVIAPLMTLSLFHFLNKRNSSDFVLAIPHTRLSIYCSYLAAILTWIAAMILAAGIGILIPSAICSNYINIMYDMVFQFMLFCFICSIQVIAAVLLAMSVSGTIFSNVILTALILFAPRLVLTMLLGVRYNIPILFVHSDQFLLLSDAINPVYGFVSCILDFYSNLSFNDVIYKAAPMIYSVVLSALYLTAAAFLFQRRKSETAGKSAPNRTLQHGYRIAFTMIYCIAIAVAMLATDVQLDAETIFYIVIAYLIGIAIYFLFELLMTKSIRKTWKAAPGLLIVLVLNVITILGIRAAVASTYQFQPDASEIKAVHFVNDNINSYESVYYVDYVQNNCTQPITDPELIASIAKELSEQTKLAKEGEGVYYSAEKYYNYQSFQLGIETQSGTKYRTVMLGGKELDQISKWMQQSMSEQGDAWRTPPEPIADTMWTYTNSGSHAQPTTKEMEELFALLKQEMQTCDFNEWYDSNAVNAEQPVFFFEYSVLNENKSTDCFVLPVYYSVHPKTAEMYSAIQYAEQKEAVKQMQDAVEGLQDMQLHEDYSLDATIYLYDETTGIHQYFIISDSILLMELLQQGILDQPIGKTDSYADIYLNIYNDNPENYYGDFVRVAITPEIAEKMMTLRS